MKTYNDMRDHNPDMVDNGPYYEDIGKGGEESLSDIPPGLLEILRANLYTHILLLPTGEIAALHSYIYTSGLCVGLNSVSYRIRYCYPSHHEALMALESWNGQGDPSGPWIKAKGRDLDGKIRDDLGPGAGNG